MDNVLHLLPRKPVIGPQKTLPFMKRSGASSLALGTSFGFDGLAFILAAVLTGCTDSVAAGDKETRGF